MVAGPDVEDNIHRRADPEYAGCSVPFDEVCCFADLETFVRGWLAGTITV